MLYNVHVMPNCISTYSYKTVRGNKVKPVIASGIRQAIEHHCVQKPGSYVLQYNLIDYHIDINDDGSVVLRDLRA